MDRREPPGILLVTLLILAVVSPAALAAAGRGESTDHQHAAEEEISVNNAWIRASVAGDENGAAYMDIRNHTTAPVRLLAARGDIAGTIELHEHIRVDGLMRMRELPYIEVPAGGELRFEPGGLHVMLFGIREEFVEGERHTMVLEFEGREPLEVSYLVQPITYRGPDAGTAGENGPAMDAGAHDHGGHEHGDHDH